MAYKIPLFDLNFGKEEEDAVIEVLRSKWISMGEKTTELENNFAERINAKHALAMTNCTAALHLALAILDIGPGDEVIVPSLTFVATANAVKYVCATPVFADITSLEDLTISPEDIEKKITDKTKAIMVMHYGGFACDMDKIMSIARKHDLKVVEDAAHSPAATYKGKYLGTIGDVSAFSFFSNKNITTAEGGMLVTNDDNLAERAKLMRSHGMTTMSYERFKGHATSYDVIEVGYNYRLDNVRSALGVSQLKKLDEDIERRKVLVKRYYENLKDIDGLIVPFMGKEEESTNYVFPVVLAESCPLDREEVRNRLSESGIQTSVHYPSVHEFSIYSENYTRLPLTEYAARREITLPLYYSMTLEQVDYVSDSLKRILE